MKKRNKKNKTKQNKLQKKCCKTDPKGFHLNNEAFEGFFQSLFVVRLKLIVQRSKRIEK